MVSFFVVKNNCTSTTCNLYGAVLSSKDELYEYELVICMVLFFVVKNKCTSTACNFIWRCFWSVKKNCTNTACDLYDDVFALKEELYE